MLILLGRPATKNNAISKEGGGEAGSNEAGASCATQQAPEKAKTYPGRGDQLTYFRDAQRHIFSLSRATTITLHEAS